MYDDEEQYEYSFEELKEIQKRMCESIYEDVRNGKKVRENDLVEAISYFIKKEEYEKCVILRNAIYVIE